MRSMLEKVMPTGTSWVTCLDENDVKKHLAESIQFAKAECAKLGVQLDDTKVELTEDAVKLAWAPALADREAKRAEQEPKGVADSPKK